MPQSVAAIGGDGRAFGLRAGGPGGLARIREEKARVAGTFLLNANEIRASGGWREGRSRVPGASGFGQSKEFRSDKRGEMARVRRSSPDSHGACGGDGRAFGLRAGGPG